MEQVAAKAGVSRQALYLHFENRSALLLAAAERANEEFGLPAKKEAAFAQASAEGALSAFIDLLADLIPATLRPALAIASACREDKDLAKIWASRAINRHATCRQLAERLSEEGRLGEDWTVDKAADWLWGITSHQFYEDLCIRRGWGRADYKRFMMQSIRSGLMGS